MSGCGGIMVTAVVEEAVVVAVAVMAVAARVA